MLDQPLGAVAEPIVRALFVFTVLALAGAAVLALAGVLRPQQRLAIASSALPQFGEFPLIAQPRVDIQGQMINTMVEALQHERRLNDRKARLTRLTALALAAAFTGVAAQAVLLGLTVG